MSPDSSLDGARHFFFLFSGNCIKIFYWSMNQCQNNETQLANSLWKENPSFLNEYKSGSFCFIDHAFCFLVLEMYFLTNDFKYLIFKPVYRTSLTNLFMREFPSRYKTNTTPSYFPMFWDVKWCLCQMGGKEKDISWNWSNKTGKHCTGWSDFFFNAELWTNKLILPCVDFKKNKNKYY